MPINYIPAIMRNVNFTSASFALFFCAFIIVRSSLTFDARIFDFIIIRYMSFNYSKCVFEVETTTELQNLSIKKCLYIFRSTYLIYHMRL